jgi:hypothetical protein
LLLALLPSRLLSFTLLHFIRPTMMGDTSGFGAVLARGNLMDWSVAIYCTQVARRITMVGRAALWFMSDRERKIMSSALSAQESG